SVKETSTALQLPCAASFKHNSPAGIALGLELTGYEKKIYGSEHEKLSPVACAFIRARNCDPKSSFGDFIAISHPVDKDTAELISREVSDGIIAPEYSEEALAILKKKKS